VQQDPVQEQAKPTRWQRSIVREIRHRAGKSDGEPLSEDDWEAVWSMHDSGSGRFMHRLWAALPGSPRCNMCGVPFSKPASLLVGPLGYRPSRKNPHICSTCVESSPPGGTKMPTGVMFADLRGFTARSEGADPGEVSSLLRRFYGCAERVLFPEAVIDKLIGDEVMALYLPYLASHYGPVPKLMMRHAGELLAAVGYGTPEGPFVDLGIGLDYGEAYVGNIGDRAVYDFTAVGDVVNTASRLQGAAGPGDIVCSDRVAARLAEPPGARVELELKGKAEAQVAYRCGVR
jgi:adenylate cyclase